MNTPEQVSFSLEQAASMFNADPLGRGVHMTNSAAADHAERLRSAAALIRDLSANQLPDWDGIGPPPAELTESPEKWAQLVAGWCERQNDVESMTYALKTAAQWIKQRDQEIGRLRTQLSQRMPPPQAFEPKAAQAPTYKEMRGEALCACSADFYLESYSGGASPEGLRRRITAEFSGGPLDISTTKDGRWPSAATQG